MLHPELKRLDQHTVPANRDEIRLFCVLCNESLRLPAFIEHYRRMGVTRFFFIDNDSSDDSNAFLMAQPDCCVFYTSGSYAASHAGRDWLNSLLDNFGPGHWIMLADSDELLVYPHCEQAKLPTLCRWLDQQGYQGLYTLMLDMYSDRRLTDIGYVRGENFLNACPYFDRDYHFVRRLGVPLIKPAFPAMEPIGGPRLRFCFPEQNTPKVWPRLKVKIMRRLKKIARRLGIIRQVTGNNPAPQAFKIPLVRWQEGYAFITSHRLNPVRLAPMTGALLHFKYFQDFSARVQNAIERNSHFDGSAEYRRYAELLAKDPDLTFIYAGSTKYQDSGDLVRLKLIKDDPQWTGK